LALLRVSRPRGKKLPTSAILAAVAVFIVAGIAVEFVFLPQASSTTVSGKATVSITTTPSIYCQGGGPNCVPPAGNLSAAVAQWVADFDARDVTGLGNFYANDALVEWTSSPEVLPNVLDGVYRGIGNIRILYGSEIGKTTALIATLSNYKETDINQDNANVSLTLTMMGNSTVVGGLAMTVNVNQEWNYVYGRWQIAWDNWNFVAFHEEFPVTATTFPQWTAMKDGENPNLVSEKSFEWHAGPYVAASVYALLVGVLAYGALRFREGRRFRSP
jgi:hypothetical protein